MKIENISKESDILRRIVKVRDAIRSKHRTLKSGREVNEHAMREAFKPIVKPLEKLVNLKPTKNLINAPPTRVKSEDPKLEDTKVKKVRIMSPKINVKKHFNEDDRDDDGNDDDDDEDNDDNNDDAIPAETFNATMSTNVDELLNEYLSLLQSNRKTDLDCVYGVRLLMNDRLMIGNSPIIFRSDEIRVGARGRYKKTVGLVELLFKKEPDESQIDPTDFDNYKDIVISTNIHRKYYKDSEPIRYGNSFKFNHYITKILHDVKHTGGGGGGEGGMSTMRYKIAKKDTNFDYVYWDDPNELVDRLRLLLASQAAGNSSHTNEIVSIIEELREADIVY